MMSLMLTKDSGVLDFKFVNGSLQTVRGVDAEQQALEFKFESFQDDWYLDLSFGIPYYGAALGHGVNVAELRGIFENAALEEPYVQSVEGFDIDVNTATRELKVTGTVLSTQGSSVDVNLATGF